MLIKTSIAHADTLDHRTIPGKVIYLDAGPALIQLVDCTSICLHNATAGGSLDMVGSRAVINVCKSGFRSELLRSATAPVH